MQDEAIEEKRTYNRKKKEKIQKYMEKMEKKKKKDTPKMRPLGVRFLENSHLLDILTNSKFGTFLDMSYK